MNTGVQRSGGTPVGAWTMSTPAGSARPKKDLDAIILAHHVPYFATATPAYAEDMVRKFAKAKTIKGFRFIRILSPCPPGWKTDPMDTTKLSRLAVQTGMFRLYEVENGEVRLNMNMAKRKPVEEYLKAQGRFKNMPAAEIAALQSRVDGLWEPEKRSAP
jgi:pyruvate/2-oxoacid:ferredoxin oxidoreductase beta subunit